MKLALIVGGPRVAVEREEAVSMNETFQRESQGRTVHKIDLSCRQWKRESLDVLVPLLQSVRDSVQFLNLADVIAGLNTEVGLGVTQLLAKLFEESDLLEINLSDNAMGPRGLKLSEAFFTNSSLRRLYLSNCGLSAESMTMLETYFLNDNGRIANSLTDLVLDRNMVGAKGAEIVGKFLPCLKNLQYFSFNGCRPDAEGTQFLCTGLMNLTKDSTHSLCHIEMEDCTFGTGDENTDAVIPFCKSIEKCSQLQQLNVAEGMLEIDGLKLLVDALKKSKAKLTHLNLSGMGTLETEGSQILADFLHSQATTLVSLTLDCNELGGEGVSILMEPFSACLNRLQSLSLNSNEVDNIGSVALVYTSFPDLKHLSLDDNMDVPKAPLKSKYGSIAYFGEDEDEDDAEEEDEDMKLVIERMAATKV
eukprot:scaffold721_cov131-Cylindrotheca_fusiformis.AAC.80